MEPSINVLGEPLQQCGTQPMTGFFRDGYCNTNAQDGGSHTLAALVSPAFLRFSAARGNDLRPLLGDGGCKWCLCVSRWRESLQAYRAGALEKEGVPRVLISATHQAALKGGVTIEDLREFALDEGGAKSQSTYIPGR